VRVAVSLPVRPLAHDRLMIANAPRVRLADRLDREWAHLSHRRPVVDRARGWGVTARPFSSLDELVVLAGLTGSRATTVAQVTAVTEDEADELLHRLVQCAQYDWLAGRVVLQRILGGLLRIAGAEQRREPDVDALSLLVGEAWLAIARYRRPRAGHVAAGLLNDARHGAFVGPRRRRGVTEVLTSPSSVVEPRLSPADSPCDELAAVLRSARDHGLAATELALVCGVVDHGTRAVARQLAVTQRTVRNRRDRVAGAIRDLVA
jgi:hypothetical protein